MGIFLSTKSFLVNDTYRVLPSTRLHEDLEGSFECIQCPPIGTGWIPEVIDGVAGKNIFIPLVEYMNCCTTTIKSNSVRLEGQIHIANLFDDLYDSIVAKVRNDLDRIMGMKCRMGGIYEDAVILIPENCIEIWCECFARHRTWKLIMRAELGAVIW
jgi:hypothetical protein